MSEQSFEPTGMHFYDRYRGEMMYVTEGEWKGWLLYKHPDGQWVSLRKATEDDMKALGVRDVR